MILTLRSAARPWIPAVWATAVPLLAQGWADAPAFSLAASDLRRAAAGVPLRSEYPVNLLLQSERLSVDAEGRRTTRIHLIYRVEQLGSLGPWGNVEAGWSRWLEARPSLRARVVAPDGGVTELNPSSIQEYQPNSQDPELFSDRKALKAPLPQLVAGSVVEVEVTRQETRPFSTAGMRSSFMFASGVPVQAYRAVLETPAGMPVQWKYEHLSEETVRKETSGGRTRYAFEMGATLPPPPLEPLQDPESQPLPVVKFCTTPSWQAAAEEYDAIVQAQVKGSSLRKEAVEAKGGARERREVVDAVLAYVQRKVRYVAMEFGEASIVPRTPGEVLARGFGDCKDKSTLVMALLAELGIKSQVALLRVASPWDADPDVPGLGIFDHCIVCTSGPDPIWVDPAARHARAGALPLGDQGRWALVIGKGTKGLVRTPRLTASANTLLRTIDLQLAAEGAAKVVETTELSGTEEVSWRSSFGSADPQALREFLKRRVVQTYKAKDLGSLDMSRAEDLSLRFRIRLEVQGAAIANTSSKDAMVAMNPWPLVSSLEEAVQPPTGRAAESRAPERSDPNPAAGGTGEIPRRSPLLLPQPSIHTHLWRIHAPEGYVHGALPPRQTWTFGPAVLEATYQAPDPRTVEATFRLVCEQRVWSPEEVMAARKALRAFGTESSPVARFQPEGEALLTGGRVREALAADRRAVEAAPAEAGPRVRLARALLAAGQGSEARRVIREALTRQPGAVAAWVAEGWILQHDAFGRRFEGDWDRAGALTAFRKALELDPKHQAARWNLALLLEYDALGRKDEPGPDLQEALALYRGLASEVKDEALEAGLLMVLARLGRYAEVHDLALARKGGGFWNGWMIAATMASRGPAAGLEEADQAFADPAARSQALVAAGDDLFSLREYSAAAEALNQGALRHEKQAKILGRAGIYARVIREDKAPSGTRDPKTLPMLYLQRLMEGTVPASRMRDLFTKAQRGQVDEALLHQQRRKVMELPGLTGQPRAVVLDALRATSEVKAEGDEVRGYLVQVKGPFLVQYFTLAQEEGTYRLVSLGMDPAAWARQAVWCLDHQDLPGAAAWIDRAVLRCGADSEKDPLQAHPVHRIRTPGKPQSALLLRLSASAILASLSPDAEAIRTLQEAYESSTAKPLKAALGVALANGLLRLDRPEEAEPLTARLVADHATSAGAAGLRAANLLALRRWKDLESLGTHWSSQDPDGAFQRVRLTSLIHLHRMAEVERALPSLGAKGSSSLYQSLALALLEEGVVSKQAMEWARKAVQLADDRSLEAERTLALALAEEGKAQEALETLWRAQELEQSPTWTAQTWYLLGRLSEAVGAPEGAKACYREANRLPHASLADSNAQVRSAVARLRALGS